MAGETAPLGAASIIPLIGAKSSHRLYGGVLILNVKLYVRRGNLNIVNMRREKDGEVI